MLGLRSCIFQAEDIKTVADWYKQVLWKDPYFEAECYIGFDAGWFELGIFKREAWYIQQWNNIEVYWWVEDIAWELERLVGLGATKKDDLVDVGWGIVMASVIDPFWNFFGIIYNPKITTK